ncbi:MAG TPA: hypothetical protein VMF30_15650 [Pirellulales bacterium]|nr:hypothetical protein [Pirellulales bacterium]
MRKFWGGSSVLAVIFIAWAISASHVRSADENQENLNSTTPDTANPDAFPEGKPPKAEKGDSDSLTPAPDKRLTALHAEFIKKAEKLAGEYVRSKQPDRAVVVYEEILKLVPDEPRAKQQLDKLRQFEAVAGRKVFEVQAKADWQDTGIRVIAGKPLKLAASGNWTLNVSQEVGPDGMEIPKVLKDVRLGALIGMINDPAAKESKPFVIGASTELSTKESGPLLVRIHDPEPADNRGSLTLEITGRFDSK